MTSKYVAIKQRELLTLILLSTVQSVMSLSIAGSTFEKFRLTNTLHPSLGRASSVMNKKNYTLKSYTL